LKEKEGKVKKVKSNNGKEVAVMTIRKSNSSSPFSKTILNQEIKEVFKAQGDYERRVKEFLVDPEIKKMAAEVLCIPGLLDPKAAVDLKSQGKFTTEQFALLTSAGWTLPSPKEIKKEEERRQIPMETKMVWLEEKDPKDDQLRAVSGTSEGTGKFRGNQAIDLSTS